MLLAVRGDLARVLPNHKKELTNTLPRTQKTIVTNGKKISHGIFESTEHGSCKAGWHGKSTKNGNTDMIITNRPDPGEAIAHVLKSPISKQTIQYFHAAAEFLVKTMWIREIRAGDYAT